MTRHDVVWRFSVAFGELATPGRLVLRESAGGWQVQREAEPGAPSGAGFDAKLRPHRAHQLATDREPQAGARKLVAQRRRPLAERLVQHLERLRVDAGPRVADRELEPRRPERPCRD